MSDRAAHTARVVNDELREFGDVVQMLWPHRDGAAESGPTREYIFVPSARAARALIPAAPRRTATAALRRGSAYPSRRSKLQVAGLATAIRAGLAPAVLRDRIRLPVGDGADTLEAWLGEVLDQPVVASLRQGPPRANQKPVLQIISPAGETVGFAKLGVSTLSRRLVAAESAALVELAATKPPGLDVPRLMYIGEWHGLAVQVQSPLPVWAAQRRADSACVAAMTHALAGAFGTERRDLADSTYLHGLRERINRLAQDAVRADLSTTLRRIERHSGGMTFGTWHGDWSPWNLATSAGRVLAWDWERFAHDVPFGFDAAHYRLAERLVLRGTGPQSAVRDLLAGAADLLAPFTSDRDEAAVTVQLYAVDLACRYATDRQDKSGARFGAITTWLLPPLVDAVSHHTGTKDRST